MPHQCCIPTAAGTKFEDSLSSSELQHFEHVEHKRRL
jgi:hypothetical protein